MMKIQLMNTYQAACFLWLGFLLGYFARKILTNKDMTTLDKMMEPANKFINHGAEN